MDIKLILLEYMMGVACVNSMHTLGRSDGYCLQNNSMGIVVTSDGSCLRTSSG